MYVSVECLISGGDFKHVCDVRARGSVGREEEVYIFVLSYGSRGACSGFGNTFVEV